VLVLDNVLYFTILILQIILLNIVLSGDNVSVIALAIRNLPEKKAKMASMIGLGGAVVLRILFTCIITLIMEIEWLHIRLIGGLLLIKITWDLINAKEEGQNEDVDSDKTLWKAVFSIIIADISMSLDNVLAIAAAADGRLWLIVLGIVMSVPIIFLGASVIAKLMNKYKIIIYVGGGLLMYAATNMIMEDGLVKQYLNHTASIVISLVCGIIVMLFGLYSIRKEKKNEVVDNIQTVNDDIPKDDVPKVV
jgi:YjbE family integral membrane protein